MSLLTPHAERRLEAPLRVLARKESKWRDIPHYRLAEQYARHRAEMNKTMGPAVSENDRRSHGWRRRAQTNARQGWLDGLLQSFGLIDRQEY
jgi:hypothetical protein